MICRPPPRDITIRFCCGCVVVYYADRGYELPVLHHGKHDRHSVKEAADMMDLAERQAWKEAARR